jgi:hypothetical protein
MKEEHIYELGIATFSFKFYLGMWHGPEVHVFWHKKQLQITYDI